MSGAITLSTVATYAAVAAGGALLAKSMSKTPGMPAVQKPEAPPQAAKAPEQTVTRGTNSGFAPGPIAAGGTMLTGGGGVDPGALLLGRNTLLGQ